MVAIHNGVCLNENVLLKNTYKIKKVISRSEVSFVYTEEVEDEGNADYKGILSKKACFT